MLATTTLQGVPLRVVTTHLAWKPKDSEDEVKALLDAVDTSEGQATLIAGDFNVGPTGKAVRSLVAGGFIDLGAASGEVTFLESPQERIDYQFVRPNAGQPAPRVEGFTRLFDGASPDLGDRARVSDHAGLLGALRWA